MPSAVDRSVNPFKRAWLMRGRRRSCRTTASSRDPGRGHRSRPQARLQSRRPRRRDEGHAPAATPAHRSRMPVPEGSRRAEFPCTGSISMRSEIPSPTRRDGRVAGRCHDRHHAATRAVERAPGGRGRRRRRWDDSARSRSPPTAPPSTSPTMTTIASGGSAIAATDPSSRPSSAMPDPRTGFQAAVAPPTAASGTTTATRCVTTVRTHA